MGNTLMTNDAGRVSPRTILVAAIAAVAVAMLGGLATDLGPWYRNLRQPSWKPSDLWFGPAWTLIFTLTAWAGVRLWSRAAPGRERATLVWAFGINGALNVAWSWIFFRARSPGWALAEVALLWLSIVVLVYLAKRLDRFASLLLLPYLVWVTFAAAINAAVLRLNPSP